MWSLFYRTKPAAAAGAVHMLFETEAAPHACEWTGASLVFSPTPDGPRRRVSSVTRCSLGWLGWSVTVVTTRPDAVPAPGTVYEHRVRGGAEGVVSVLSRRQEPPTEIALPTRALYAALLLGSGRRVQLTDYVNARLASFSEGRSDVRLADVALAHAGEQGTATALLVVLGDLRELRFEADAVIEWS
jgi:hypothetical protein